MFRRLTGLNRPRRNRSHLQLLWLGIQRRAIRCLKLQLPETLGETTILLQVRRPVVHQVVAQIKNTGFTKRLDDEKNGRQGIR